MDARLERGGDLLEPHAPSELAGVVLLVFAQAHDERGGEPSRTFGNVFLLAAFVLLVGGGIWIASLLDKARRADNCIAQGRRNCARIEAPLRER